MFVFLLLSLGLRRLVGSCREMEPQQQQVKVFSVPTG